MDWKIFLEYLEKISQAKHLKDEERLEIMSRSCMNRRSDLITSTLLNRPKTEKNEVQKKT